MHMELFHVHLMNIWVDSFERLYVMDSLGYYPWIVTHGYLEAGAC